MKIQQLCIVGDPDFVIVLAGVPILMELKKSDKEYLSELQDYNIARGQRAGAFVIEACPENWQNVTKLLTKISQETFKKWERICLK